MAAETKVRSGGEPKVSLSAKIVSSAKVRRETKVRGTQEPKVGS